MDRYLVDSRRDDNNEVFEPPAYSQLWIDSMVKRLEQAGKWKGVASRQWKTNLGTREPKETQPLETQVVDGGLIDDVSPTHDAMLDRN